MDESEKIIDIEVQKFLLNLEKENKITPKDRERITEKVTSGIKNWLHDVYVSPQIKAGIQKAIKSNTWNNLIEAFWQDIIFGTGGIRGRAVSNEKELQQFAQEGFRSEILRGPNTINEIILMKYTTGVAKFLIENNYQKAVVGYDSRLHGKEFADLVAKIFLANGIRVYLFEEACPYPELSFAVTHLKADIGIEISASHNDKRYNGYKISNRFGASLGLSEREMILSFIFGDNTKGIPPVTTHDIKPINFELRENNRLTYLGGEKPIRDIGKTQFIDIHSKHLNAIKKFIINSELIKQYSSELNIGYCAFYGAGYKAVPKILHDMGFSKLKIVHEMNRLDGWFPAFKIDQVIDPGEEKPAEIGVNHFISEYGEEAFRDLDVFLGTDPDADRLGVIVNLPEKQQEKLGKWKILEANDVWTLLLWYRLKAESDAYGGKIPDTARKFIVRNHVTTDALVKMSDKFGITSETTWVGFGFLAERVIQKWNDGFINIGMFEESNGFSIGGAPPRQGDVKGTGGHTMEKDGTLASVLLLEVACYAKSLGKTLVDLLDEIYADPQVGFYATCKTQLPKEGVFEGIDGDIHKKNIIKNLVAFAQNVNDLAAQGKPYHVAGLSIKRAELYSTGKYDKIYWPGVPDEGIRFYLNEEESSYVTIRPSGTEAKLRFMVHMHVPFADQADLTDEKYHAHKLLKRIAEEFTEIAQKGVI